MASVELLNYTPLPICAKAVRKCWQSQDRADSSETIIGDADAKLIKKVVNGYKHASTFEHIYYTFDIRGISRALLQELARHRIASLSVKSTRYTLKELESVPSFEIPRVKPFVDSIYDMVRVAEYCVMTTNPLVDWYIATALENLRKLKAQGIPNDIAKFALPEAYKTELIWSINARSLQNFLFLRTDKAAMWEIRKLAYAIAEALPEDHKYMYEEAVKL